MEIFSSNKILPSISKPIDQGKAENIAQKIGNGAQTDEELMDALAESQDPWAC